jgi:hypothetical protein
MGSVYQQGGIARAQTLGRCTDLLLCDFHLYFILLNL